MEMEKEIEIETALVIDFILYGAAETERYMRISTMEHEDADCRRDRGRRNIAMYVEKHHRGHTMVRPDARVTLSRTDKFVLCLSMHSGHPLVVLGTIYM